ncbi:hypothetical protein BaraCB756_17695 [Bradyrhizobium arachidis]|nr:MULTISPECIES: hypothetical protein [Bradyrhizobium]QOG20783.1 hypothetical protein FOM02_28985 [Bradyrhizobium sp. SEMIA]UFW52722.1 hypothetical protein BaraCB756_17695 [Bradyrhizobium arachidis]
MDAQLRKSAAAKEALPWRSRTGSWGWPPGNEHDAAAEELAGPGEFGGKMPGMPDGRILIDAVVSDAIGTDTVFVGDVKEEAHAPD